METTLNVDITDYLSQGEIKDIIKEELRDKVRSILGNEENTVRILSNLSYQLVFDEVDKVVPNSRQVIHDKICKIIQNKDFSYLVFRDADNWSKASLASTYILNAVQENKDLINNKVKDTITNHNYSDEIWQKFEELGENFTANIYEITNLGRNKK